MNDYDYSEVGFEEYALNCFTKKFIDNKFNDEEKALEDYFTHVKQAQKIASLNNTTIDEVNIRTNFALVYQSKDVNQAGFVRDGAKAIYDKASIYFSIEPAINLKESDVDIVNIAYGLEYHVSYSKLKEVLLEAGIEVDFPSFDELDHRTQIYGDAKGNTKYLITKDKVKHL